MMKMSACLICGADGFYNGRVKMVCCPICADEMPDKLTRSEFDVAYWKDHISTVPKSTRDEFYEDYRASKMDLEAYIKATVRQDI